MDLYCTGLEEGSFEHLIFGHIGDNNLHVNILPRSRDELEAGRKLFLQWAGEVVRMGGDGLG